MSDGSVGRSKSPEKIKFLVLSINRVSVFTQDAPLNIQSKSLHGKPYFLFPDVLKRWSFQKNCAGIWSFLYYRERWYFFFPKIWSYTLDGKWKMIFLKKIHGNMIFSSNFLKRWSFQKGLCRHMIFLVLFGKLVFFSRKHDIFSLGRKWKTVFLRKYMETWCIALQRRKTGNIIYRIEVWLLKFIRLEIFYNEYSTILCTIQPSGVVFGGVLEGQSRKLLVH